MPTGPWKKADVANFASFSLISYVRYLLHFPLFSRFRISPRRRFLAFYDRPPKNPLGNGRALKAEEEWRRTNRIFEFCPDSQTAPEKKAESLGFLSTFFCVLSWIMFVFVSLRQIICVLAFRPSPSIENIGWLEATAWFKIVFSSFICFPIKLHASPAWKKVWKTEGGNEERRRRHVWGCYPISAAACTHVQQSLSFLSSRFRLIRKF